MKMIMKNMNVAPVTAFPNPMQMRELTDSELANIVGGEGCCGSRNHHAEPTGNYKYTYFMGVRVYRKIEVRCTKCGNTYWVHKIL